MNHVSLFSGIGGIDLATEWAGFKTVCFVEIDSYCQKVLKKHWPDVPIIGDIKDVTKERIEEILTNSNIKRCGNTLERQNTLPKPLGRNESGEGWRDRNAAAATNFPITLITGGFPCQPVSHAGKRKGKDDDRWLWPEMLRVISEIRPTWVVAENVAGLLNMGFNDCVSDLESAGYETQSFLIPACAVNAPHRRDRVFMVAYSRNIRQLVCGNTYRGNQGINRSDKQPTISTSNPGREWWAVEPELGRVAYGIPKRVDRLRCLGNAVVPQQIYPILKAIADIEQINSVEECWGKKRRNKQINITKEGG